jgi:hypothetical protein
MTFMATTPMPALAAVAIHARVHGEVVGRENHVERALLRHPWEQLLLAAVRTDTGKANLALLLGCLLGLDHVVMDFVPAAMAVQIPDIDVIRIQFAQALFEVLLHPRLVRRVRLGREHNLLPLCTQRRAHHALIVAVRIAARGIEVVDAGIGGALNDTAVRRDHAAESHGGHLQPRATQYFVVELYR